MEALVESASLCADDLSAAILCPPGIDCGAAFLKPDGWIDYSLMPDGVHPAGPGGQALVDCVLGALGVLPA